MFILIVSVCLSIDTLSKLIIIGLLFKVMFDI